MRPDRHISHIRPTCLTSHSGSQAVSLGSDVRSARPRRRAARPRPRARATACGCGLRAVVRGALAARDRRQRRRPGRPTRTSPRASRTARPCRRWPTGEKDPDGADQNILLIGNDTRAGATPAELKAAARRPRHDHRQRRHDDAAARAGQRLAGLDRLLPARLVGDDPRLRPRQDQRRPTPTATTPRWRTHESEVAAESAGIIQVIKTIHALTGLYVDHYMQVSLLGFYRISNAIGGVRVCLNAAQNTTTEVGDGGHGNSGIDLPKGVSVIKGTQALAFVRQRHGLPNGDLDRIKRQQYFLQVRVREDHHGRHAAQPVQAARPARRRRPLAADRPDARPALARAADGVADHRARSPSRPSRTTARR